ncbi:IF-2B domain-containing protein [Thermosipho atlanticus]|uniref:Initiation factor 2 subunit family protein n=1 Tax=Thermosipho atlanticus DSM 15807 TaxID=1123380 RepID=A0A1M5QUA2_9BACT|nr:initiation factor 2B [Thermosipho atlanticus]SHH17340.1 Initiation factor 2 subunit family protein [Thermosipho atlanticus DSM 15807]
MERLKIINDFVNLVKEGSIEVANWILDKFESIDYDTTKILIKDFIFLKPDMSVIRWIEKKLNENLSIAQIKKELNNSLNETLENATKFFNFEASVVTISNSQTLFEFFKKINHKLNIYIPESRPGGEGFTLFEKLSNLHHNIKLINDMEIHKFVQISDYAISSADGILENGDIVNKIGTKLLAITATYYNKPFFVIADKTKYFGQIPKDSIFEIVPKSLITAIIT